jgi:hypothetical protein
VVSQDYEDLFKVLNAYRIKYLVVGAHAVVFYTKPRFTKDLDVWIPPELNDPKRVYAALKAYGTPLRGVSVKDFADKQMFYQIGVAPVRIDILMSVPGVSARNAWKNRQKSRYGKANVFILSKEELISAKKEIGRPEDLLDLRKLERSRK